MCANLFSCSKKEEAKNEDKDLPSIAPTISYERFSSERLMLRVPTNKSRSGELVSIKFSYIGEEGVEKVYHEHESMISNLIRTTVVDYNLSEIKMSHGQNKLAQSLLKSINNYVGENKFIKVQVLDVREI